jgi:DNA-binding GntR family transcriptional regulator
LKSNTLARRKSQANSTSGKLGTQERLRREAESEISLGERAYREIEERIVTMELAPGRLVSEASLSVKLKIGRTPVREALQRLAQERMVVIMPRRGIFVADINVATQLRLLELRRGLERLLARCSAKRATSIERERFKRIAEEMNRAADKDDDISFLRLDREFNQLVATSARNEFTSSAIGLVSGLARRFWYLHYRQIADLPLAARLHADVALAVAAGNPDRAEAASDVLIDYIENFTRATLSASAD